MNGEQIRGQKRMLSGDVNEIKLGLCVMSLRYAVLVLSDVTVFL